MNTVNDRIDDILETAMDWQSSYNPEYADKYKNEAKQAILQLIKEENIKTINNFLNEKSKTAEKEI